MRTFVQKPKATQQTTSAKSTIPGRADIVQSRVNAILHSQRTMAEPDGLEAVSDATASGRFGHHFSRVPVNAKASGEIQSRLALSSLGDTYEREADRVAEQVVRMPEPKLQHTRAFGSGCTKCNKEGDGIKPLEIQGRQASGTEEVETPSSVHEVLRSPGQPLESGMREFMEPRFGHDFSRVRVHTDANSAETARMLNSRAYTVGHHVVFASGEYAPGTVQGNRLLAHELTHVVQQNRSVRASIQRWSFGTSPPAGTIQVPPDHRARVRAGMDILSRVAGNRRCREFFRDNCTAGLGSGELATALADVEVYETPSEGELFGSSPTRTAAADPREISYNLTAYRIGRWELAATLLHEMFHTCILGTIPNEEVTAETAVEVCHLFTPFILEVSPRSGAAGTTVMIRGFGFGPSQEAVDRVTFNGVDAGAADSWVLSNVDSMVRIRIRVPAGAATGPVVVENNGIRSNPAAFTVV